MEWAFIGKPFIKRKEFAIKLKFFLFSNFLLKKKKKIKIITKKVDKNKSKKQSIKLMHIMKSLTMDGNNGNRG
jgi:hypothetical protein